MKCINEKYNGVVIKKIELINWLVNNNELLKIYESKSSLLSPMEIKKNEEMGIMISAPKSLGKL
jgi:hypothetical protein